METRLIALKLFLDTLEVQPKIDTIDDRKRVQKVVYLGQLFGPHLGYRFGWYLKGPYSPELTADYYALAEALKAGDESYKGQRLVSAGATALSRVIPLLNPPRGVSLSQPDWLELLSSMHFLRTARGQSSKDALALLKETKPHVAKYAPQAEDVLRKQKLIR